MQKSVKMSQTEMYLKVDAWIIILKCLIKNSLKISKLSLRRQKACVQLVFQQGFDHVHNLEALNEHIKYDTADYIGLNK